MGNTILLADDSITIQKVIELTFSDEDFSLHTVGNGQKAIEEVRSVMPDIVLCDIIMPEKNGYEVCEFIKSSDDLRHIPVLLLTGAFEPFDQERAKKAGCDGFLAKPFEPQTLISKVKELLASAGAAATRAIPATEQAPQRAAPPPPPVTPAHEPKPPLPVTPPPETAAPVRPPPAAKTPPPAQEDEGATIMADSFVVEAGERELSVEPGDQTMLLGEDETPTVPSEDIWREVQQDDVPSRPAATRDESATVFMETEAIPGERMTTESGDTGGGFDDFASPEESPASAGSDTWVLSSEEEPLSEPPEPELTPLGDFGGFDDFSPEQAPRVEEPEPIADEAPSFAPEPQPPRAPPGPPEFEMPGPPRAPAARRSPETPISQLPVSAEAEQELGLSQEEPSPFEVPPPHRRPAPRTASPTPIVEAPEPEEPIFEAEPFMAEPAAETPRASARPSPPPASPPAPAAQQAVPLPGDIDALVDKIAEKVVAKLSEKVVKELAWEVVPDMAETMIQKEIDALKAKIPK